MKNNPQNIHQRIIKNKLGEVNYTMSNHSISYNMSSETKMFPNSSLLNNYVYKHVNLKKGVLEKTSQELIIEKIGSDAFDYVEHFVDMSSEKTQLLFSNKDQVTKVGVYENVVSLQSFNSIMKLDAYLIKANQSLEDNGKFVGFVKTNDQREQKKWIDKVPVLGKVSAIGEFTFHRIFPKINGFKQIYFGLTQGKFQHLSKAEVLGRLIKFGFKIVELEENIDGVMYFVVKKVKNPDVKSKASNGLIYKFPRIGKGGKLIRVYKVRTMHPYSEYLQDYILNTNGYGSDGKPSNDFRVPSWAKFVRRYWIDEIPQLVNVLKGEMKLFGVRPVTKRYFQDIPEHIQKLRLLQKPGCIPPYVAYNKESSKESVLRAEENYLNLSKKGFLVDLKFMVLAVKNILINKKRGS